MLSSKLHIKNVGPVKEADLLLKKVNVIIGPQASGKSTIGKVLALNKSIKNSSNKVTIFKDFDLEGFVDSDSVVNFINDEIEENIVDKLIQTKISLRLQNDFDLYKRNSDFQQKSESSARMKDFVKTSMYIPTERNMVSTLMNNTFLFLENKSINIPKLVLDFGYNFQVFKSKNKHQKLGILDLDFINDNNEDKLVDSNEVKYSLSQASSGLQSLVPLLVVFNGIINEKQKRTFIIEEPELNLYPNTQNELIQYIVSNTLANDCEVLFTTHSPYTLSALNNMIFAYQQGQKHFDKTNEIMPERLWVNPADVSAYMMTNDGVAIDILDPESGLIISEMIDGVSEQLNHQFDALFNLDYA